MPEETEIPVSEPENMTATGETPLEQHNKPNVQILYETTSAIFSNQVIVNSGRDQIILDFSTGNHLRSRFRSACFANPIKDCDDSR